jgi:murein DD-endopeptidase MepM/ murein hydrolase activator NlpD
MWICAGHATSCEIDVTFTTRKLCKTSPKADRGGDVLTPVVVDFPLRGEWIAPNTPARRVPSHGTDMLGQRFAFDFVAVDARSGGTRFYGASPLRYVLLGVRLRDCYGWGRPIFSPVAGTVIQVEDGWPERHRVHPLRDLAIALKNALTFDPTRAQDLRAVAGNYVIIEMPEAYAVLAHAQTGSVKVSVGERVVVGQHLANVGHSGNSTSPHLHFHLMDGPDPRTASGVPCCFHEYEALRQGVWRTVHNGVPEHTDRIRVTGP